MKANYKTKTTPYLQAEARLDSLDNQFTEWVTRDKIHLFQKMAEYLYKVVGNREKSAELIGITHTTLWDVTRGEKVSAPTGRKILAAYKIQRARS